LCRRHHLAIFAFSLPVGKPIYRRVVSCEAFLS
jgi:hypothetical protein